eukprot:9260026-Prorocentrum_lima.AAC.1
MWANLVSTYSSCRFAVCMGHHVAMFSLGAWHSKKSLWFVRGESLSRLAMEGGTSCVDSCASITA